jgi:acyl carrier protein
VTVEQSQSTTGTGPADPAAARGVVRQSLDHPALLDRVADDADLVGAGVNSGELIRVALRCEELLGRPLGDEELADLTSIAAVADLLAGQPAAAAEGAR